MNWSYAPGLLLYGLVFGWLIFRIYRRRDSWSRKLWDFVRFLPIALGMALLGGIAAFPMSGSVGLIGGGIAGAIGGLVLALLFASSPEEFNRANSRSPAQREA